MASASSGPRSAASPCPSGPACAACCPSPPPPSADTPYEAKAELLPRTLAEALAALREDAVFQKAFGKVFVEYYCTLKEAEIARFNLEVTEWEQREYFDLY